IHEHRRLIERIARSPGAAAEREIKRAIEVGVAAEADEMADLTPPRRVGGEAQRRQRAERDREHPRAVARPAIEVLEGGIEVVDGPLGDLEGDEVGKKRRQDLETGGGED